jgi:sialate O-acetylesterase
MSREALESDPDFKPILDRAKSNLGYGRGMYNAMIHPLIPYGIRGAIWYQGESNATRGIQYRKLFQAMIEDWRTRWGQGDFPFYYVQLCPYKDHHAEWPEVWEAQLMTLSVPNTGMAVTTDIGNPRDIHPRNKQDVGKRLALWALAKTYGKDIVYSGPLYKDVKFEGGKAVVTFNHVGGGLVSRNEKELSHFQLAGEDKKFVAAKAEIVGDTVVVTAEGVDKPAFVRFGWDHIAEPNLSNKEGLPASPFRTDK